MGKVSKLISTTAFGSTTQALYWERGRLARSEREARARGKVEPLARSLAPCGARCGRAARAPSK